MYTAFIALHAGAGLLALAAGCLAVWRGSYFRLYFWSLVAVIAFLAAAVGLEWTALDSGSRVLFVAFVVLGAYMIWRAELARRILATGTACGSARYLDHIGFTVVGLFDAFAVIAVLDLGAPVGTVVGVGVLIAVAGHLTLRTLRSRRTLARIAR